MRSPTADEVRAARKAANLTQKQSANVVHTVARTWLGWENAGCNARPMPPAVFELFCIKTGNENFFRNLEKQIPD
jgi:DNA-binding transcriptional regulator YiaG